MMNKPYNDEEFEEYKKAIQDDDFCFEYEDISALIATVDHWKEENKKLTEQLRFANGYCNTIREQLDAALKLIEELK